VERRRQETAERAIDLADDMKPSGWSATSAQGVVVVTCTDVAFGGIGARKGHPYQ